MGIATAAALRGGGGRWSPAARLSERPVLCCAVLCCAVRQEAPCLFDLQADLQERRNVANSSENAAVLKSAQPGYACRPAALFGVHAP